MKYLPRKAGRYLPLVASIGVVVLGLAAYGFADYGGNDGSGGYIIVDNGNYGGYTTGTPIQGQTNPTPVPTTSPTISPTVSPSPSPSPSPSASPTATALTTATGSIGTYVTDGSGRAVYVYTLDTTGTSNCTGTCATAWPPVLTPNGLIPSGTGITATIGTIVLSDGTTQLTLNGMPLYYFVTDRSSGQISGEGAKVGGGNFYLVGPDGTPLTGASPSPSPSSSPSPSPSSSP